MRRKVTDRTLPKLKAKIPSVESFADRNLEMFKLWVTGMSHKAIGAQFGVTENTVWRVSKKKDWKKYRKLLEARRYKSAIESLKPTTMVAIQIVNRDLELLKKRVLDGNQEMNKAERDYVLHMIELYVKENRLEDGKPTENLGGNIERTIHLKLPAGFPKEKAGLIPPPSNVILVETPIGATDKKKADAVDLDAIDDNGDGPE